MPKFTVLFGVVLFFLPLRSHGFTPSSPEYGDLILLKNGATIMGKIVERIEGKKIVIEMEDGYRIEVPFKKIEYVTRYDDTTIEDRREMLKIRYSKIPLEHDQQVLAQTGILAGRHSLYNCFELIIGYMVKERTFLGVIVGLNYFLQNYYLEWGVPLGMGYRKWLSKKASRPFVYAEGGYTLILRTRSPLWGTKRSTWEGGAMAGAGFGMSVVLTSDYRFYTQAGYRFQDTERFGGMHLFVMMVGLRMW